MIKVNTEYFNYEYLFFAIGRAFLHIGHIFTLLGYRIKENSVVGRIEDVVTVRSAREHEASMEFHLLFDTQCVSQYRCRILAEISRSRKRRRNGVLPPHEIPQCTSDKQKGRQYCHPLSPPDKHHTNKCYSVTTTVPFISLCPSPQKVGQEKVNVPTVEVSNITPPSTSVTTIVSNFAPCLVS